MTAQEAREKQSESLKKFLKSLDSNAKKIVNFVKDRIEKVTADWKFINTKSLHITVFSQQFTIAGKDDVNVICAVRPRYERRTDRVVRV